MLDNIVRGLCKIVELNEGRAQHISTFDAKGLVKVLPRGDSGDKAGDYCCINGFAIDYYSTLLHERRCAYPKGCPSSIFMKTHQLVSVLHITAMSGSIV